jgi:hypothetical protein
MVLASERRMLALAVEQTQIGRIEREAAPYAL